MRGAGLNSEPEWCGAAEPSEDDLFFRVRAGRWVAPPQISGLNFGVHFVLSSIGHFIHETSISPKIVYVKTMLELSFSL